MAVLRKRGVVRNLLIETETCEPPPRQMHAQFLNKFALAADPLQIADQHNPQQQFRIDGRPLIRTDFFNTHSPKHSSRVL